MLAPKLRSGKEQWLDRTGILRGCQLLTQLAGRSMTCPYALQKTYMDMTAFKIKERLAALFL
jgi:hypothetical protein